VVTVSVAGVPGATEPGLIEHCGARVGAGCTEQESVTEPLNPAMALMLKFEVEDPPALIVLGENAAAESEKSGLVGAILKITPQPPVPHERSPPLAALP
jgi:hypothetical protein